MASKEKEIREQLDRILLSEDFQTSKGLVDFLRFVVEETLAGRANEINQRTVGIRGLGYPPNFDPQSNPAVRMQASRLRRALDKYYSTQGAKALLRIEIPKGRYVPTFLPNHESSKRVSTNDNLKTAIPPVAEAHYLHKSPSIAILPFEYLGHGDEHAYFTSGITEELVIALTGFPELLVIGPLNREVIRQGNLGPRDIGHEYRVRFILDGTVRLRGKSLRITAKLTDTLVGHHLWGQAHDYDLEESSMHQIDDDVVGKVVATIADSYGVIPRALAKESMDQRNESLTDYEAILRYYHSFYVLTPQSHAEAVQALEGALERNPDNVMAAGMLGDLILSSYQYGYFDDVSILDRAERLARKAIARDPNSQPARFTMALIHFLREEHTQFLAESEKSLTLNPNHALYSAALALHLYMAGERARGVELMEKTMRLNPHHPGWYHLVPYMEAYRQGNYESALIESRRFNIPVFYFDPMIRAAVLGQLEQREEAAETVDELLALVPDFETRGRSLIRRFAYLEDNVDMLVDGLQKAGMIIH